MYSRVIDWVHTAATGSVIVNRFGGKNGGWKETNSISSKENLEDAHNSQKVSVRYNLIVHPKLAFYIPRILAKNIAIIVRP